MLTIACHGPADGARAILGTAPGIAPGSALKDLVSERRRRTRDLSIPFAQRLSPSDGLNGHGAGESGFDAPHTANAPRRGDVHRIRLSISQSPRPIGKRRSQNSADSVDTECHHSDRSRYACFLSRCEQPGERGSPHLGCQASSSGDLAVPRSDGTVGYRRLRKSCTPCHRPKADDVSTSLTHQ